MILGLWALLLGLVPFAQAYSPNPDLTANGAIATLKTDSNASPVYGESYNLGPTGLRGWIYIDRNNMGNDGLQTAQSRQILVTVASTPGSAVLAVDDVILGAMSGSTGAVPLFTSDCRKAFGAAIGDAEKTGAGTLRVKRWRGPFPGTTTDVNIPMTIMGDYTATAPYSCPKSALILANARTYFVGQLLANASFLSNDLGGAVDGLALLAGVAPGDANYATVQTRLQTYARGLVPSAALVGCDTWNWAYINIFLSEYYLRTVVDGAPDAQVLPGINAYTVALAKGQSKYGTYGHGGAERHADGSLHGSISWYGPVNSAGIPANIAIVLGKIALQAGGQAIDAEIDPAIERGSNFFGWFVNKGSIPYGEHEPYNNGHASNGKDAMCAVLFALQANRPVETEYFTRITTAGCTGREYGHTGQGFSYLWGAMGANMGGPAAVAAYLNNVRWHLDLERRTDGSFVYDGGEQYGGGTTSGGTYLGASELYGGMHPTAWYVLSYALPLQRLYITGRNANPANTLDAAKVAKAIAAATYKLDCKDTVNYPVSRLMTDLGEWDPAVRAYVAAELGVRTLTGTEINTLITMAEGPDANTRQGACEVLGIRKTTSALPALGRRLSDADLWVRGKAANALRQFGAAASPQLTPMLTAFAANATDPNVIVWTDPIQISNGYLADTLFQAMASTTIAADKSLLYPAVTAGLKQPDGMARMYLGDFIKNRLTYADVQAVAPSIVDAVAERSPADRMFSDAIRYAGLQTLAKYKIEEGIPLALMVKEQTWHGDDWDPFNLLTNTYRGAARDALPTLYKWQAHIPQFAADGSIGGCCPARLQNIIDKIASTIAAIENDTNPPTLNYFKTLAATATPATVTLPTNSVVLASTLTDLDAGVPNFVWTKVSGAGAVTFNPAGPTASPSSTATFDTPGTYVLRVQAVDRSILDYVIWITYSLGYFDFHTYNEILGAVSATVTVTVGADANRAPVPQNQSVTTVLNTAVPITLSATDPNGDAMTYAVVAPPTHGSLSGTAPNLTYTPTGGYTGPDSFTFKANDGRVDSAVATVTIDVGTVGNRRPVAVNQYATTPEDIAKPITLTGTDPDNDALTYQVVTGPLNGTLSGTAPNLTYTPAANYPAGNFNGTDSFTFTVSDASLTSAVATVSITLTPVNDPPQPFAQGVSVSVNTVNPITLVGSDPDGYGLLYTVVAKPTHGTLSGTAPNLTFVPALNYHGPDSFTFKVTDSEGSVSLTATVSITIINDPPVANPQSVEVTPNVAKAITLSGSDNANDALTYVVVAQPTNGVLSGTAPTLTYTPNANFTGADSFTFKVNDGANDSPVATVSLNVVQWQTWANIAPGTWSTGANWTGGVAPTAGGAANGLLAFNTTPYAASSSNNLAGTFQLNRWNLGAALPALTVSGNLLSFAINGTTLPQVNQDSANTVTVSNNLALAASTTVGGSGAGALTFSGVISGVGTLSKTSPGTLTVSAINSYGGGTTVTGGILNPHGNGSGSTRAFFGTGTVTMAGGTTIKPTDQTGQPVDMNHPFVLSGGIVSVPIPFGGATDLRLRGNISGPGGLAISGGTRWLALYGTNTFSGGVSVNNGNQVRINTASALGTGALSLGNAGTGSLVTLTNLTGVQVTNTIDLTFAGVLTVNTGSGGLNLAGVIQNTGSLTKIGSNTLTLSGTNTYTGTTTVSGGILAIPNAASLGSGPLVISSGTVALSYTGTRQVSALTLGSTVQTNYGTYGSLASAATYKSSSFTGNGTVTRAPATSTALALTTGSTPANQGTSLTFTATVAGSTPTGNVAFYAGATLIGTTALNGSFQASVTTSSLAPGSYNITAKYAGDANDGPSNSAALPVQVLATSTPPAAPGNLAATPGSNAVGLTWTASGGATGYVVKRSPTNGGPYVGVGTASATSFNDTPATNGTTYFYVVSATNNGGEGSNSTQVTATPAGLPSTTSLASSQGAAATYGTSVIFTATVTVSGGPATGVVTFRDGATVLGTGSLNGSSQATYATAALAFGAHSITASYAGDATFSASTSPAFGYTANAKPVTITGVTAASKVYNASNTATLSGGTVSGVVNGDTVTVVAGTGTFASANVGTWAVTATGYSLGGSGAGNYVLSAQPTVPNASITARPIQLTGARVYDGTAIAAAGILTIQNNLDGGNLGLTGSANLAGKDVGARALSTVAGATLVRSSTGSTGANAATSFNVTMSASAGAGNTMIAVISTRGTAADRVTGITQTGSTWSRVTQATNTNGTTTEIWSAPDVAGGGTTVTINQASLRSAAVVMEYSGVLTAGAVDQLASSTGSSTAPVTGTTPTTAQANELWVAGVGFISSAPTLGSISNGFSSITSAQSSNSTASNNAKVYALQRVVSATAAAFSGGALSASAQWAGAIATFRALTPTTLALTGSAAGNYTVVGASGTVAISAKALTVSGQTAGNKAYDGTTGATLAGTAALLAAEAPGTGTTGDGKPYTGDTVTLGGTTVGAFGNKHAGNAKPVTVTGATLAGAQAGNYTLTAPTGLAGNITQLPITVTAVTASKVWDGTTNATGTPTLSPVLVAGDTTTVLAQAFQDPGAGVGNKVIVPSIAITDGNGGANYAVTLVNFLSGTITPQSITDWRTSYFNQSEITAGLAADGVDADGDGITNLDEYLLGTDPRSATQPPLTITRNGNNCTLNFVARAATGNGYGGLTRKYDLISTIDIKTPSSWAGVSGFTGIVGNGQNVDAVLPIAPPNKTYRLKVWLE